MLPRAAAMIAVIVECKTCYAVGVSDGFRENFKGEGVIGLSRALVYAGAEKIIVSFWNVPDQSTAELMKNFYKELLNSSEENFATSLQQAKLVLMRDMKYASPYYWAPFVLIGY